MAYTKKTFRRRSYRRKPVSKPVKAYVSKAIASSRHVKEYRTGGLHNLASSSAPSSIASSALSYIVKGDELWNRESNAVYLKKVQVRWNLENNSVVQHRLIRMLIVQENTVNTGSVSSTGIFTDTDQISQDASGLQNRLCWPINTKLWKVHYDKLVSLAPKATGVPMIKHGKYDVKLNRRVVFYPESAATTATSTGHFYIVTILGDTSVTTDTLEFNFMARVFFTDSTSFIRTR